MAVDSGVLLGEVLGVVENLADHEAQHVTALTDLLNSVGATPVEKPAFTFPEHALSSQASIPDLAANLAPESGVLRSKRVSFPLIKHPT